MAKLVEVYENAVMLEERRVVVKEDVDSFDKYVGMLGRLEVYESERLKPGQKFVAFILPGDGWMKTSPGLLQVEDDILTITTHEGSNYYKFRLIQDIAAYWEARLPEKFLHVCEVCGKSEILSPQEAFDAGWDYPPRMGSFGVLSPRTCGNCAMTDTLYWKLTTGEKSGEDLTENQLETIHRIMGEPESLFVVS